MHAGDENERTTPSMRTTPFTYLKRGWRKRINDVRRDADNTAWTPGGPVRMAVAEWDNVQTTRSPHLPSFWHDMVPPMAWSAFCAGVCTCRMQM